MKTTTATRTRRISLRIILFSLALLLTLFITFTAAQEEEDDDSSPLPTTDDPTTIAPPPSSPDTPPSPSPLPPSDTPTQPVQQPQQPAETTPKPPKTTTEPPITLPSVLYIPPVSFNINNDALEPIFPTGSESCQKCKYFYPKLKECNQIANRTLALLPRLVPVAGSNNNDTMTLVYPGANGTDPGTGAAMPTQTSPPSTFTTLLPFLQCICPNQGLAATKVCMTCFRVSNQRNFLDQLMLQNVSNSLSAFQEACQDSNDGTMVPPAGSKGQSASFAAPSPTLCVSSSTWVMMVLVGVVAISLSSSFLSIF